MLNGSGTNGSITGIQGGLCKGLDGGNEDSGSSDVGSDGGSGDASEDVGPGDTGEDSGFDGMKVGVFRSKPSEDGGESRGAYWMTGPPPLSASMAARTSCACTPGSTFGQTRTIFPSLLTRNVMRDDMPRMLGTP